MIFYILSLIEHNGTMIIPRKNIEGEPMTDTEILLREEKMKERNEVV